MTSQKGSIFLNFEFLTLSTVFPPQKDCSCSFLDANNHFIEFSGILGDFRAILGHFGSFWGSVTSQKWSRFQNFEFLTLSSVFPPTKDCPCTFLDPNNHFIEFSGFLGDFRTILGHFRGP